MNTTLNIPYCPDLAYDTDLEQVSIKLRKANKTDLSFAPWSAFPYKPSVHFSMVHSHDCIFIRFDVEEQYVAATYCNVNAPVYKDSCVEFFFAIDETGYYNLEFNCTGARLGGFGKGRANRVELPVEALEKINSISSVSRNINHQGITWSLTLAIPIDLMVYHQLPSLKGLNFRGNFYKCGDDLPEPHFISWSNIVAKEPNFHLPEYFGILHFNE